MLKPGSKRQREHDNRGRNRGQSPIVQATVGKVENSSEIENVHRQRG